MSETLPAYQAKQPEYFFLKTPEKLFRIRVPWICIRAVMEIIESPQGHRTHDITFGYIPGPEKTRQISTGAAAHILEWARIEGWIE